MLETFLFVVPFYVVGIFINFAIQYFYNEWPLELALWWAVTWPLDVYYWIKEYRIIVIKTRR